MNLAKLISGLLSIYQNLTLNYDNGKSEIALVMGLIELLN
jgi:hypothetical protein